MAEEIKKDLVDKGRVFVLDGRVLGVLAELNVENINMFINTYSPRDALKLDPQGLNAKAMVFVTTKLLGKGHEGSRVANPGLKWWQNPEAQRDRGLYVSSGRQLAALRKERGAGAGVASPTTSPDAAREWALAERARDPSIAFLSFLLRLLGRIRRGHTAAWDRATAAFWAGAAAGPFGDAALSDAWVLGGLPRLAPVGVGGAIARALGKGGATLRTAGVASDAGAAELLVARAWRRAGARRCAPPSAP